MPASYFPHADGLTLSEGMELLGTLLGDPRIRIIEMTEYAALRDLDQRYVSKLVDLLTEGLRPRDTDLATSSHVRSMGPVGQ